MESVANTLATLPPDMPTVLVGFVESADVVYEGLAGGRAAFERTLRTAAPTGATDLAAALERARLHVAELAERPLFVRLLLVTDDLTAPGDLLQAAYDCARARITVDVVVLDPSRRVSELAGAIVGVTGGTWEAAAGGEELAGTVAAAGRRAAWQLRQAEAESGRPATRRRSATRGRSRPAAPAASAAPAAPTEPVAPAGPAGPVEPVVAAEPAVPPAEPTVPVEPVVPEAPVEPVPPGVSAERSAVLFTARHPVAAVAGEWRALTVGVPAAPGSVPAGTELEIAPTVPHLRFRPPRVPVVWGSEPETASFEVIHVPGGGGDERCHGQVQISLGGLPVARIPLELAVSTAADPSTTPVTATGSAPMFREIYGSYAQADLDIARRFREIYRALGITLFLDVLDVDGTREWKPELEAAIDRADLFALFWSPGSAAAGYVEKEWRRALEVAANRRPRGAFVFPFQWSRPAPEPPLPLGDLPFREVDPWSAALNRFANPDRAGAGAGTGTVPGPTPVPSGQTGTGRPGGPSGSSAPGGEGTARRRVDVTFPVFSLVPALSGGNVERIGESLRTVVPFLEDLTGLRYYPPPTYVTDDTTVTSLRRNCEPDARHFAVEHTGDVPPGVLDLGDEAVTDRVRELLLVFHSHVLDVGPGTDLEHVRREAAGGFVGNARRYLAGRPTDLGAGSEHPAGTEPPLIWRQRCAEDFPSFAGLYSELVTRYVDRHIRANSRNRIDPGVRARLVAELGPRAAEAIERSVGGVVVDPPVDHAFRARLGAALEELRLLVDTREPVVSDYLRSGAPAFGVFRHTGGAGRFGRSGMLVPTSAPAVLMGAGAFRWIAAALRGDAVVDEPTWDRAAAFCEMALVHEHAHAAIATGLDDHGARAGAAGTPAWAAASRLNEALAAWTQRHYYRRDPRMWEECARYIRSGSLRSWPYRGADVLEERYAAEGVEAVRRFIRLLRDSPEAAQAQFDLLLAR
ncbi:toll/interleukin-1 receptor domain-containing protein [Parafrankia discariae]|uniref:toll/interleukin-1 receptor domain-containing protein n=1 Tax=Parafrankia discariae TaxID=365528 RepID=UPI000476FBE0|nr:toll/interleukin-1 receptor domain-containing protein [Parafrankia discariae]